MCSVCIEVTDQVWIYLIFSNAKKQLVCKDGNMDSESLSVSRPSITRPTGMWDLVDAGCEFRALGLSWPVTIWENAHWIFTSLVADLVAGRSEYTLIVAQPTIVLQI